MQNKKPGIIIVNYVLDILQIICVTVGGLGVYYCALQSAANDGSEMGGVGVFWGLLVMGMALALSGFATFALSVANAIVSIVVLRRYGKKISAIISLVFSVIVVLGVAIFFCR